MYKHIYQPPSGGWYILTHIHTTPLVWCVGITYWTGPSGPVQYNHTCWSVRTNMCVYTHIFCQIYLAKYMLVSKIEAGRKCRVHFFRKIMAKKSPKNRPKMRKTKMKTLEKHKKIRRHEMQILKNSIRKRPFFPQKNAKTQKSARSNFPAKNARKRACTRPRGQRAKGRRRHFGRKCRQPFRVGRRQRKKVWSKKENFHLVKFAFGSNWSSFFLKRFDRTIKIKKRRKRIS